MNEHEVMTWQAWTVLAMILVTLVLLFLEVGSPEQIMLGTLVVLWNMGIVSTPDALDGFSNTGLISIGALFIVMQAVDKSRVVDYAARRILGAQISDRVVLLRICFLVFALSGFCNNTPLVVLFMPIVRDWARTHQRAPSTFLIPLSYSAIMGGMLTTIGTSTNLLVNGLLEKEGYKPFGFFEPAIVGLPMGILSFTLIILLGPLVLPDNKGGLFREVREHGDNLVTALDIAEDSPWVGRPAVDVLISMGLPPSSLLKIRRRMPADKAPSPLHLTLGSAEPKELILPPSEASTSDELEHSFQVRFLNLDIEATCEGDPDIMEVQPVRNTETAQGGDLLLLSLPRDRVVEVMSKQERGIRVRSMHASQAATGQSEFVELVLSASSPLLGQPICNAAQIVSDGYNAGLIAVRSRYWGTSFATSDKPDEMGDSPFRRKSSATFMAGDVILVLGATGNSYSNSHFLLVTRLGSLPKPMSWYDVIPLVVFVPALVLTSLDMISMVQLSVTLSCMFILGGWIKASDIRTIVDWQLLILIGSALGVAQAMAKSGLAAGISRGIIATGLPNWLAPSLLYLIVMVTTEMVTNNAAAALGVPLAVDLAEKMGLASPHPLVMVVMIAASTSFASPIGYATNLIVMGPGGYSFLDFLRPPRYNVPVHTRLQQASFPHGSTEASVQHALLSFGTRAEPLLSKLAALSQSLRAAKQKAVEQSHENIRLKHQAVTQAGMCLKLADLKKQNLFFEERRRQLQQQDEVLMSTNRSQLERFRMASEDLAAARQRLHDGIPATLRTRLEMQAWTSSDAEEKVA
ncbi:unnamed protein product [Symbiodinium microadriaticum]|nr:unnamed protein product [Symbiodinium microadriaticum]CAE7942248.1 unnamed protein product [Symbiodinium sp. KB8]